MTTTRDCVTQPPTEPGRYCVSIANVRSLMPIYWVHDGKKWTHTPMAFNLKEGTAVWYPQDES